LEFELRRNEIVIMTLEEPWHVVLHAGKMDIREMLKTAYRPSLFRTPILTDQRLVLLKGNEIDYEVPLGKINATSHRQLKIGTPYLRLQSGNSELVDIVFECITERVSFGAAVEAEIAWKMTKKWVGGINQANMRTKKTSSIESQSGTDTTLNTTISEYCTECGINLPSDANYCPGCGRQQSSTRG
jgi:hypothetical protein